MSRSTSTYTAATFATSQFFDSRATPMAVPSKVASTMPMIATRSVLSTPMMSARKYVSLGR